MNSSIEMDISMARKDALRIILWAKKFISSNTNAFRPFQIYHPIAKSCDQFKCFTVST
ncbi:hypothetical protein LguiB_011893 [Lonicera macranthoides]